MNSKFLAGIIAVISLLSSCKGKETREINNVLFPEINTNVANGKLSEIISISDAAVLGDYEDLLVGRIKKIEKFNDTHFAILSSNSPVVIFDSGTNKFTKIGEIGGGEAEYATPLDFDVDSDGVYVLTMNGIKHYEFDGNYLNTIQTDINADGIKVADDRILLFVLGDENVIHLIDKEGNAIAEELPRNAALRISRANPFYEFDDYVLFHEGHSNDILAYDRGSTSFCHFNILPTDNAMSIAEEANLIENGVKPTEQGKTFFDAFATGGQQLVVGLMKGGKPYIYVADNNKGTANAISLSDIDDDILYAGATSFFTKGTVSDDKFITYIYPYVLIENRDQILKSTSCPDKIKEFAMNVNENDNPIVIAYEFK